MRQPGIENIKIEIIITGCKCNNHLKKVSKTREVVRQSSTKFDHNKTLRQSNIGRFYTRDG